MDKFLKKSLKSSQLPPPKVHSSTITKKSEKLIVLQLGSSMVRQKKLMTWMLEKVCCEQLLNLTEMLEAFIRISGAFSWEIKL